MVWEIGCDCTIPSGLTSFCFCAFRFAHCYSVPTSRCPHPFASLYSRSARSYILESRYQYPFSHSHPLFEKAFAHQYLQLSFPLSLSTFSLSMFVVAEAGASAAISALNAFAVSYLSFPARGESTASVSTHIYISRYCVSVMHASAHHSSSLSVFILLR